MPAKSVEARSFAAAEIRRATPRDVPALARLGARLARMHHRFDPARFFLPEEPIEDGYAWWLGKELANRRAVILAATVRARGGERVIGYAYGRMEGRDWNTLRDRCGVGVDLWVEPRARKARVGTRLVEALVAALESLGAERVVLSVAARNSEAEGLFHRLGFRPTMLEMTREAGGARPAGASSSRAGSRLRSRRSPPR